MLQHDLIFFRRPSFAKFHCDHCRLMLFLKSTLNVSWPLNVKILVVCVHHKYIGLQKVPLTRISEESANCSLYRWVYWQIALVWLGFAIWYYLLTSSYFFIQGLEQLRSGILQQKSFIQNQQQLHQQIQMLTPQQQQQLMLQAQQNLSSPTSSDVDNRRLRMMLNSRNAVLGRDGQTNSGTDIIPNIASPSQSGGDIDILIKVYLSNLFLCLSVFPSNWWNLFFRVIWPQCWWQILAMSS